VISGNLVGLNAAGTGDVGNALYGINIAVGGDNTIGGASPGAGNVIAGNDLLEVQVSSPAAANNRIQGNVVGLGLDGVTPIGNAIGIWVDASNTLVGGIAAGSGNRISGVRGVVVDGGLTDATNVSILGNSIVGRAGLAIDLTPANVTGVTPNDVGDADAGPNALQNFPVLSSVGVGAGNTTVAGSINSTANTALRIEFYSAPTGNASGHGDAVTYLGFANVTTDASGNASFNITLTGVSVTPGHAVSATATVDLGGGNHGDTSEAPASRSAHSTRSLPKRVTPPA
jgi:hypothetical protein